MRQNWELVIRIFPFHVFGSHLQGLIISNAGGGWEAAIGLNDWCPVAQNAIDVNTGLASLWGHLFLLVLFPEKRKWGGEENSWKRVHTFFSSLFLGCLQYSGSSWCVTCKEEQHFGIFGEWKAKAVGGQKQSRSPETIFSLSDSLV